MQKAFDLLKKSKLNKYHITIIIFIVVTFFIGDNTFLDGMRYNVINKSLQNDVEILRKENEKKFQLLNLLQADKDGLEIFAREQFQMSKENEDLFLIVD